MRLVFASDKLVIAGRSFAGMPLLIHEGKAVEPAQTFLWTLLTRAGRAESKATWKKYGQAIYDFFAFCKTNGVDWAAPSAGGLPTALDWYRDWSKGTLGLNAGTVNQRLRLIVRFYEWALRTGLITRVPYESANVRTNRQPGLLSHVDATAGKVRSPAVLLREQKRTVRFLSGVEVKACLARLSNPTHRLMFELMTRTGLRQIECRTFPDKYVFDPARGKRAVQGRMIRVSLEPADMKLKFDKPRSIDVPYGLMEDLWAYSVRHRAKRARAGGDGLAAPLFLTEQGRIFSDTALTDVFARLERRVGFHVRPHMLRHTYATYTLLSLRAANFAGEPLLYVRDRLGHSSVVSTSIYLHVINELSAALLLEHESELDALFNTSSERNP